MGVDRDGPLESARGLLHDVAQIFEALNHGFKGQPPLGIDDIAAVVTAIILPIAAPGDANNIFDPIIQAVTDFDHLSFLVAKVAQDTGRNFEAATSQLVHMACKPPPGCRPH